MRNSEVEGRQITAIMSRGVGGDVRNHHNLQGDFRGLNIRRVAK